MFSGDLHDDKLSTEPQLSHYWKRILTLECEPAHKFSRKTQILLIQSCGKQITEKPTFAVCKMATLFPRSVVRAGGVPGVRVGADVFKSSAISPSENSFSPKRHQVALAYKYRPRFTIIWTQNLLNVHVSDARDKQEGPCGRILGCPAC